MTTNDIEATSERISTGELLCVAATIRDNGGWDIAALKVEAAAARISALQRNLEDTHKAWAGSRIVWGQEMQAAEDKLAAANARIAEARGIAQRCLSVAKDERLPCRCEATSGYKYTCEPCRAIAAAGSFLDTTKPLSTPPAGSFLTSTEWDFCDKHETEFPMSGKCPKCAPPAGSKQGTHGHGEPCTWNPPLGGSGGACCPICFPPADSEENNND